MLSPFARLRNRASRRVAAVNAVPACSERERVVALVRASRVKLAPFIQIEDQRRLVWNNAPPQMVLYPRVKKLMDKLGQLDGVGALIKMASYTIDEGAGTIANDELARFHVECQALVADIQGACLNYSMIVTLTLTIYVALIALKTGESAYYPDDHYEADPTVSLYADRCDFAAWIWPGDMEAQRGLRRGLYCAECVTLALGPIACFMGLEECLFLYTCLSTGLASVISRCEFILHHPERLAMLFMGHALSVDVLMVGLPFVAARASAMMFLCVLTTSCLYLIVYVSYLTGTYGSMTLVLQAQHSEARRLLLGSVSASNGARCGGGDGGGGAATTASSETENGHSRPPDEELSAADDGLADFVSTALEAQAPHSTVSRATQALRREGFSLSVLREVALAGQLSDVVAVLSGPSLGLRSGERAALAAAIVNRLK